MTDRKGFVGYENNIGEVVQFGKVVGVGDSLSTIGSLAPTKPSVVPTGNGSSTTQKGK